MRGPERAPRGGDGGDGSRRASPPSPPRSTPTTPRVAAALRDAVDAEPDEIHAAAFVLDSLRGGASGRSCTPRASKGALVEIVNRGGDCDTVGAVAGALAGARYGADAIPARWLEPLLVRERVTALADGLAERAGA